MNKALTNWLVHYGIANVLVPLKGDASVRKYYRVANKGIVMDASDQPESVKPFVDIAHRLLEAGVRTPKINIFDLKQGFIFMEDMGDTHFSDRIADEKKSIYPKAVDTIIKMQQADTEGLPLYDHAFLRAEMDLMQEWYLDKYLKMSITKRQQQHLEKTLEKIVDTVLEQPQGFFVHRDYHSRNLMFDCNGELVVIDFQDARAGSLTYDLVSLLRDVYVMLEPAEVERLALYFRDIKGIDVDDATFLKWFDFTGLQRHIKILGIFARLALRDGKEGYLKNIPLTLYYIHEIASRYEETVPLLEILNNIT